MIYEKLAMIQDEMKVPKNLYNSFGNYYFRNAETIKAAAKPICKKYKTTLVVTEKPIQVGDRHYIEATATLYDWESNEKAEATASAREPENKKGMDDSQISGTAGSYASKYAMNGLFGLDDIKDADTEEYANETKAKAKKGYDPDEDSGEPATDKQMTTIMRLDKKVIDNIVNHYGLEDISEITKDQASETIGKILEKRNAKV